ncbi:MAG: hypothetical protein GY822_17835 [Deltaproteobacteria bacterium]|nr:hypothetical protein [Deltaproteobacteria bacterium]
MALGIGTRPLPRTLAKDTANAAEKTTAADASAEVQGDAVEVKTPQESTKSEAQTPAPANRETQKGARQQHLRGSQGLASSLHSQLPNQTPSSDALAKDPALLVKTALNAGSSNCAAKQNVGAALGKDPALVEQILKTATPAQAKALGQAGVTAFTQAIANDPSKRTAENFTRMVKLFEAIDPKASAGDVSRELRRTFYPDHGAFMNLGDGGEKTGASKDLTAAVAESHGFLGSIREIKGPDGKELDIAHSLISVDARANSPLTGRARAALYTDVGDGIQGALNAIGIDAGGDMNAPDVRGNDFGEQLGDAAAANPNARLSDLLEANLQPGTFLQ